jgi:hypothetical protein
MTKYTLGELDRKISNMYEIKTCIKTDGRAKKSEAIARSLFCWVCSDYDHSKVWKFLNFKDHTLFYYYLKTHNELCDIDKLYEQVAKGFLDTLIIFDHPEDSKQTQFYNKVSEIERLLKEIKELI